MFYVGLDVASEKHDCCILNEGAVSKCELQENCPLQKLDKSRENPVSIGFSRPYCWANF